MSDAPIDMILFCPNCGQQHIDAPDERMAGWTNPPHKSHLCHGCKYVWRPADVPTNGVAAIKTKGNNDSPAWRRIDENAKEGNVWLRIACRVRAFWDEELKTWVLSRDFHMESIHDPEVYMPVDTSK